MPVAAGAIHAARKKKQAELAKKKEKLAKQRAADDEAASKAYAQIDASSVGSIDRDQVRQLLAAVTGQAEIDEDGLEMVVKAARKAAGLTERPDAPLPRDAVLSSVRKYRLYLREKKKVDELVRRWDFDGNGTLLELGNTHRNGTTKRHVGCLAYRNVISFQSRQRKCLLRWSLARMLDVVKFGFEMEVRLACAESNRTKNKDA